MKRWIASAVLVVMLSCPASACTWEGDDTLAEVAAVAVLIGDWSQSRYIARNPDRFHEFNPVLGSHPSPEAVDAYFASVIVVHAAVAWLLPKKAVLFGHEVNPRRMWQYVSIGFEAGIIVGNANAGIRFEF